MGIRSTRSIYQLVEDKLGSSDSPLTVTTLMDDMDIRREALSEFGDDVRTATNKLSDVLGFMWRRGLLTRYPAPRETNSFARYAYALFKQPEETPPKPILSPARSKTMVGITEHSDCVEIEFDKFVILIRPK